MKKVLIILKNLLTTQTTILSFLICVSLLVSSLVYATNEKNNTVSVPVVVHQGQTLWTICEREAKVVGDTRDIREIVYETAAHNGIKGGMVYAGQKIEVQIRRSEK